METHLDGLRASLDLKRATWNERKANRYRLPTGAYDIAGLRAGAPSLPAFETAEIGELAGKRLVHLLCHFGKDTLSRALLGADATGLDIAEPANAARRPPDIRAWAERWRARFARVARSTWPRAIPLRESSRRSEAGACRPPIGGRRWTSRLRPMSRAPARDSDRVRQSSYRHVDAPRYDILGALSSAGMGLNVLNEHELLFWKTSPMMVPAGHKLCRLPDGVVWFPESFSLRARRVEATP